MQPGQSTTKERQQHKAGACGQRRKWRAVFADDEEKDDDDDDGDDGEEEDDDQDEVGESEKSTDIDAETSSKQ